MEPLLVFSVLVGTAVLCTFLTAAARRYAHQLGLLDRPGPRRSHAQPTPRGGGIAWVLSFGLGVLAMVVLGQLSPWPVVVIAIGVLATGCLGWWDDHQALPNTLRLLVQAGIAAWVLWQLGGVAEVRIGPWRLADGWYLQGLAWLAMLWLTNLYNFMDGIDGLAAWQGLLAFSAMILLATGADLPSIAVVAAAATCGFIPWNWPRARVFMGDAGSGAMGFCLACCCLLGVDGGLSVPLTIVILAVFVVDASATLLLRVITGQRWYTPHREHAYQLLVRAGWSHWQVVAMVMAINIGFIWPLLWWTHGRPWGELWAAITVLVVLLMAWLAIRLWARGQTQHA